MEYLKKPDFEQLFVTIRDKALKSWGAAVDRLNPAYAASLTTEATPAAQLMVQLTDINRTKRLVDGTVPIEVVLGALKLLSMNDEVVSVVTRLLAKIEGEHGMGTAPGETLAYTAVGEQEAYTGETDDTVPFDFMENGVMTGRSVARILVKRFEDGNPGVNGKGEHRVFKGTGWMATKDLFITNFHVVSARELDEPDPSEGDLKLQIANTEIHLDYDREKADPRVLTGVELVAFGARVKTHPSGERDYAILRVKPLTDRWPAALKLRVEPPSVPKDGYPVNIIQHPQGWPKRVAMRSNLLKSATKKQLEYFGDTLGGSSGSPLCNDAWEVIGLHRASGPATNVVVNGDRAAAYNVGIPIAAVIEDLKATKAEIANEIVASVVPPKT